MSESESIQAKNAKKANSWGQQLNPIFKFTAFIHKFGIYKIWKIFPALNVKIYGRLFGTIYLHFIQKAHRKIIPGLTALFPEKSQKEIRRILDDIVANLIWDSDKTNVFVIEGDFDLDGDGKIDKDAADKIKSLIGKWGGKVANAISIETDFLVLGRPPSILIRPTVTELEMDPMATERYEASRQKRVLYGEVQNQAKALLIPIFNYERFLFFIGYKTQSGTAGAF